MLAAPLMAGNDLDAMSEETKEILTNVEAIAVDQDSLGIQGFKYKVEDGVEYWFKPLKDQAWAVTFLNRSDSEKEINFNWVNEKVVDTLNNIDAQFNEVTYELRDLWKHKDLGKTNKALKSKVPPHDVLMLKLTKQ